jgi:hypothetical protein
MEIAKVLKYFFTQEKSPKVQEQSRHDKSLEYFTPKYLSSSERYLLSCQRSRRMCLCINMRQLEFSSTLEFKYEATAAEQGS